MENDEIENKEEEIIDETQDLVVPYRYSIAVYGADYPVDSLVKRLSEDVIFIPPFQRAYVWTLNQAARFIESLLLGLPVPGIFFSKETDTGKLLVIDGQQRLRTLQFFYDGIFKGKQFNLKNVQKQFEGKNYKTLEEPDRLRLDDSIIHATVIRQEEPSDDDSSVYHVFERLNTGGTLLQPQEIRACIYHGSFNELLNSMSKAPAWQQVYGPPSNRLKDQELILRFFALYFDVENYSRPMKEFLNKYMGENRHLELQNEETLKGILDPTIEYIAEALGQKAFRPERSINAAVYDSTMVGIARRLRFGPIEDMSQFKERYDQLLANERYMESCRTATSDKANVDIRIRIATEHFGDL